MCCVESIFQIWQWLEDLFPWKDWNSISVQPVLLSLKIKLISIYNEPVWEMNIQNQRVCFQIPFIFFISKMKCFKHEGLFIFLKVAVGYEDVNKWAEFRVASLYLWEDHACNIWKCIINAKMHKIHSSMSLTLNQSEVPKVISGIIKVKCQLAITQL